MKSGMADGGALVDAHRQVAHRRDLVRDLEAEQDAARAGLRALADHDLDGVGLAHVVRVVAVVARRHLVDERLRRLSLAPVHAAVAGRRRRADDRRGPPERLLRVRRQRAEAHPGDADRRRQADRARGAGPEHRPRLALLPVALERDARERARDEREIVEARRPARGRVRAHDVAAELRLALDVLDRLGRPHMRDTRQAHARSSPATAPARRSRAPPSPDAALDRRSSGPVPPYCALRPAAESSVRGTRRLRAGDEAGVS